MGAVLWELKWRSLCVPFVVALDAIEHEFYWEQIRLDMKLYCTLSNIFIAQRSELFFEKCRNITKF